MCGCKPHRTKNGLSVPLFMLTLSIRQTGYSVAIRTWNRIAKKNGELQIIPVQQKPLTNQKVRSIAMLNSRSICKILVGLKHPRIPQFPNSKNKFTNRSSPNIHKYPNFQKTHKLSNIPKKKVGARHGFQLLAGAPWLPPNIFGKPRY